MCNEDDDAEIHNPADLANAVKGGLELLEGMREATVYTFEELTLDKAGVRVVLEDGRTFDMEIIER